MKLSKWLPAAAAALGLALSGAALAQKAETPKDAKKPEAKMDAKKPEAAPKADAKKAEPAAPKGEPMDINSASEKELATLKGIGEVRAKAIVKGRPYKGKDDLVKKKIIPQNVYDDIKDQIIAKQDAMKAEPKKDEKKAEAKPADKKPADAKPAAPAKPDAKDSKGK